MRSMPYFIEAGARDSLLSQAQVKEVLKDLRLHYPEAAFKTRYLKTYGDLDRKTSLRELDKTDFFTREIDRLLLSGEVRIGIHSAKDLPDPIPEGLKIVAITEGINPGDSLVLRKGESLGSLPPGAKIATSSLRREEMVRQLRDDLEFIDLRGTIGERLKYLNAGLADGVVIAEAALVRLRMTRLNRIPLPGETVPGQGKLAITARTDDREMAELFSCLDGRTRTLCLGLEKPEETFDNTYTHFPVIKTVPLEVKMPKPVEATHLLFTSKSGVRSFFDRSFDLPDQTVIIAVGKKTAREVESHGFRVAHIAADERQEGVVELFEKLSLEEARILWPRSSLARPLIARYLQKRGVPLIELPLYETVSNRPERLVDPDSFDEVFFTSPSTVQGYLDLFGSLPEKAKIAAIGPVTREALLTAETAGALASH